MHGWIFIYKGNMFGLVSTRNLSIMPSSEERQMMKLML